MKAKECQASVSTKDKAVQTDPIVLRAGEEASFLIDYGAVNKNLCPMIRRRVMSRWEALQREMASILGGEEAEEPITEALNNLINLDASVGDDFSELDEMTELREVFQFRSTEILQEGESLSGDDDSTLPKMSGMATEPLPEGDDGPVCETVGVEPLPGGGDTAPPETAASELSLGSDGIPNPEAAVVEPSPGGDGTTSDGDEGLPNDDAPPEPINEGRLSGDNGSKSPEPADEEVREGVMGVVRDLEGMLRLQLQQLSSADEV